MAIVTKDEQKGFPVSKTSIRILLVWWIIESIIMKAISSSIFLFLLQSDKNGQGFKKNASVRNYMTVQELFNCKSLYFC